MGQHIFSSQTDTRRSRVQVSDPENQAAAHGSSLGDVCNVEIGGRRGEMAAVDAVFISKYALAPSPWNKDIRLLGFFLKKTPNVVECKQWQCWQG